MNDLSSRIVEIGYSAAFPFSEEMAQCGDCGMTYRQWLIGQALAGTSDIDIKYAHQNAKAAIAHADEVIRLLAEEAQAEAEGGGDA